MLTHIDHQPQHASSPTLEECIAAYFVDFAARVSIGDASDTTLRAYRSAAQHIPAEMRLRPVTAIRRADVKQWHRGLAGRVARDGHRLTAAADHALKALACVYNWLLNEQELPGLELSPVLGVKRVHRPIGGRALDDRELADWRAAVDVHEYHRTLRVRGLRMGHPKLGAAYSPTVALRLLDLTGARSSEIRTLRVEDLELDRLRPQFKLRATKSGEGRVRPLSGPAVAEIQRHLARLGQPTTGWLFPSTRCPGLPISDSCLARCFEQVADVADVRGTSRHSLRHTMITRGFLLGFTSTDAAGAAGHKKEMAFTDYRHGIPGGSYALLEAHAQPLRRSI